MKGILVAGAISLFLSFFGTPGLIKMLAKRGYGQIIRDDGPTTHHVKRGTPTMGGIILIFASFVGFFLSHLVTGVTISISALLILALVLGLGGVGFLDDWLKVSRKQSLGLSGKQKLLGQALIAAIFGIFATRFPDENNLTPMSLNLSAVRDTSLKLGAVV